MSHLMHKSCEPDMLYEAEVTHHGSGAHSRRRRSEEFDSENMSPTASAPAAKRTGPQHPCDTLATEFLWEAGVHASGISFAYEHCACGPASVVTATVLRHLMHGAGGSRPCSGVRGVFNFEDFVRFSLAQADRMRTTSCIYWMRALDLDHDGVVGARDLEHVHTLRQQEAEHRYGTGWEQCSSLNAWAKIPTVPFLRGMAVFARGRERFRPGGAPEAEGERADDIEHFPELTAASLQRRRPDGTERGWTFFSSVFAVDGCNGLQDALRFLHEEDEIATASWAEQEQEQEVPVAAAHASGGALPSAEADPSAVAAGAARHGAADAHALDMLQVEDGTAGGTDSSEAGSSVPDASHASSSGRRVMSDFGMGSLSESKEDSSSSSGSKGLSGSQRDKTAGHLSRKSSSSPAAMGKFRASAEPSSASHEDAFCADDAAIPGAASEGSDPEASAASRATGAAASTGNLFTSAGDFASPALPLHRPVNRQQQLPRGVILLHASQGEADAIAAAEAGGLSLARSDEGTIRRNGTSSASVSTLPAPSWTLVPASSGGGSTAQISGADSGSTGFSPLPTSGHSVVFSGGNQPRRLAIDMPATIAEGDDLLA